MNKVILIGNLCKDVELRQTNTGISALVNTIAVRRNFPNQNGEYESDFINFVAYRGAAEVIANHFSKGSKIGLEGRWQKRSYNTVNGETRYVDEMIVESIEFIEPKKQTPKDDVNDYNPWDIPNPSGKQQASNNSYDDGLDINDDDLPF